jgi:hypothetical protein
VDDKPIPVEKRLPGIDRNVAQALNAVIQKDARKRPATAREFIKGIGG